MAKGIFIVDIPECCSYCDYSYYQPNEDWGDGDYCSLSGDPCGVFNSPDWCPIKEIPKEDNEDYFPDEYQSGYRDGWNSCIREILKNEMG